MKIPHRSTGYLAIAALVGAAALAPLRATAAQAAKLDDPTIIAIFDAANSWDLETGELAALRSAQLLRGWVESGLIAAM